MVIAVSATMAIGVAGRGACVAQYAHSGPTWYGTQIVFMVLAIDAFLRDRDLLPGVWLGLAVAAKFFPALLLIPSASTGCVRAGDGMRRDWLRGRARRGWS